MLSRLPSEREAIAAALGSLARVVGPLAAVGVSYECMEWRFQGPGVTEGFWDLNSNEWIAQLCPSLYGRAIDAGTGFG